jgi:hypothetical protein
VIVVSGVPPDENCTDVDAWLGKPDMFPALLDKIREFVGEGCPGELRRA